MGTNQAVEEASCLRVENIGGIDETTVNISPGVTALVGRNATNRTSLLQAITAACNTEHVSLKGDADEGTAELTIDGTTYTRTLTRNGDSITATGGSYLDDPAPADLFAFLLESNEARQAASETTISATSLCAPSIPRPSKPKSSGSKLSAASSIKRSTNSTSGLRTSAMNSTPNRPNRRR